MIERCYYRISIKALIWNENKTKFLIALEDNGYREFPWGGLDHGEDPVIWLHRELMEELWLKATHIWDNPSYFITTKNHKWQEIGNVFYEVQLEHLNFIPSDECVELKFVTPQEALELNSFTNVQELSKLLIIQAKETLQNLTTYSKIIVI